MKILFYCDTVFSFGGVQRVLAEVAKALCVNHEVTILTIDHQKDMSMYGYVESTVRFDYLSYSACSLMECLLCRSYSFLYKKLLPHTNYTSNLYAKSFFLPTYKKILIQKINVGRYDVIIGVHAFMSLHLSAVKNKVHGKIIGWMHNSYEAFFEKDNPYLSGLDCFFQSQMRKLDKVIVLSHADADRFFQKMNLETKVIYNPLTVKPEGKGSFKHKKILAVGRFSFRHKGFDILIRAFSIFVELHPDWVLEIVGEGPEESLYRSLIKSYKLEQSIRLCPFTENIQSYYAHSSVYVLSSRWEGFGLVLIEAMAHGLPVIASDLPITRELLKDRGVALLFENENVTQLAECMKNMAERCDVEMMGNKALEYVQKFTMGKVCKEWNELLKEMTNGTR